MLSVGVLNLGTRQCLGDKMLNDSDDTKRHFESVDGVIDALVRSESLTDFCRAIVHSEFTQNHVQGCHIFSLTGDSTLVLVSGYGLSKWDSASAISVWDAEAISESVRTKAHKLEQSDEDQGKGVLAIPLLKENIPIGALALVLEPKTKTLPIHENLIPILSKLGTYCLHTLSSSNPKMSNGFQVPREANGEELTSRQIRILELMADGMVNVEIARELMLSESTIRQETVKIYRALGVPNRADAAKKGRALGLIKRPPPPLERVS